MKPTAAAILAGTPSFAVPKKTLSDFAAEDFPLIIVADHDGIIRWMQTGNDTLLIEGGQIDQLMTHVTQQWPTPTP